MFTKGYAVKGLHFDCRSEKQWVRFLHISILTISTIEQYITNVLTQVQILGNIYIFVRELSLMEKHMTFNHYYMSSNLIALIKLINLIY